MVGWARRIAHNRRFQTFITRESELLVRLGQLRTEIELLEHELRAAGKGGRGPARAPISE